MGARLLFGSFVLALAGVMGCQQPPAVESPVPPLNAGNFAYQPEKPLPPDAMGITTPPGQMEAIEAAFLKAYQARRSPRIMILVNRTIHAGAVLPDDTLEALARQPDAKQDSISAMPADYDMIELSLVDYFSRSGQVTVKDAAAARGKLEREKILRLENGDADAVRLLAGEFQTDILIRVVASPTAHASTGTAVRLTARAVGTTDAVYYGTAMADITLPLTRSNINNATYAVAHKLMDDMSRKLAGQNDPLEVRVYKAKTVDDAQLIRKFIQKTQGVTQVRTVVSTGGQATAYTSLVVYYNGSPEDFYAAVKENAALSKGLKATEITHNTVTLEVEAALDLKVQVIVPNEQTGKSETRIVAITPGPEGT